MSRREPGFASVPIEVDSRVRLPEAAISAECGQELRTSFAYANAKHHKLVAMGYRPPKSEPAVIKTWAREGALLTFPRGGFRKVRAVLARHGHAWAVDDVRTEGDSRWRGKIPDYRGFEPRDYQTKAVEAILAKQNCLLRAGTGSGKTSVMLMLAARLKLPTLVIVWSGPLFAQWKKRCVSELGMRPHEVGEVQGKTRRFGAVTVAMQQTLWKRVEKDRELREWPGFVVVDEVQRAAARTVRDVVDAFPAKYRVGASDDERRADGKEFLVYDQFGDVALEAKYDDLADAGYVLDVEIRVVLTGWEPSEPYEGDWNALLDEMTSSAERNRIAVDLIAEEVAAGEQVLAMSERVAHCHAIDAAAAARGARSGLLLGGEEWREVYRATSAGLERGDLRVGVGTIANVGTGIDLPLMGVSVACTPIAGNESRFRQARGRVCRVARGKAGARMYYLLDRPYERSHLRNMTKWSRRVVVRVGAEWVPVAEYLGR